MFISNLKKIKEKLNLVYLVAHWLRVLPVAYPGFPREEALLIDTN